MTTDTSSRPCQGEDREQLIYNSYESSKESLHNNWYQHWI